MYQIDTISFPYQYCNQSCDVNCFFQEKVLSVVRMLHIVGNELRVALLCRTTFFFA